MYREANYAGMISAIIGTSKHKEYSKKTFGNKRDVGQAV